MSVLIVSYGTPEASALINRNIPIVNDPEAHLSMRGRNQSLKIGQRLRQTYALEPAMTDVAISKHLLTHETAEMAGFDPEFFGRYAVLNSVQVSYGGKKLEAMLERGELPAIALQRAEKILSNPPSEPVWVGDTLLAPSIARVMGIRDRDTLVTEFGEIREIPIASIVDRIP